MRQPIVFHFRSGSGRGGGLALLAAFLIFAGITLLIAIFALGLLVILAPVMLVAAAVYYLLPSSWKRRGRGADGPTIIDGEYRVLEVGADRFGEDHPPKSGPASEN